VPLLGTAQVGSPVGAESCYRPAEMPDPEAITARQSGQSMGTA
jgi:hypothetical protein